MVVINVTFLYIVPLMKEITDVWGLPLMAQLVKNLPPVQETWVRFLGWDDPLEKGKATHSSILA